MECAFLNLKFIIKNVFFHASATFSYVPSDINTMIWAKDTLQSETETLAVFPIQSFIQKNRFNQD